MLGAAVVYLHRKGGIEEDISDRLRQLLETVRGQESFDRLLRAIAEDGDIRRVERAERLLHRRNREGDTRRLSKAIWRGARHDTKLWGFIKHSFLIQAREFGRRNMSQVSRALRGIIPGDRKPQAMVSTRRGVLELRITQPFFDMRQPPDALVVKIAPPEAPERAAGLKVTLRVEVIRSRVLDALSHRYAPVLASRNKTLEWPDLYDWSGLLEILTSSGAAWMKKTYTELVDEAETEADSVNEARKRRIRRRLTTSPRRFYGKAKPGERSSRRLSPAARPPRRLVRPRVAATNPAPPDELRRWDNYYRVNKGRIKSRGKQMRRLPWYREYQKRLRKVALSKGTRRR